MNWDDEIENIKKLAGVNEFRGYKPYEGSNISITGTEKRRLEKKTQYQAGY